MLSLSQVVGCQWPGRAGKRPRVPRQRHGHRYRSPEEPRFARHVTATPLAREKVVSDWDVYGGALFRFWSSGIGSFTIVDKNLVGPTDTGNNFFVDAVAEPRAKRTKELLNELNESVQGSFLVKDASEIIREHPEFFLDFNVVIVTDLPEADLLELGNILWAMQIPLFVVRVCGFMGYLRIVVPEHCSECWTSMRAGWIYLESQATNSLLCCGLVVETHPEHTLDLRLDAPFPALREAAESFGEFDKMDDHLHAHIPYVIILYKYLQNWAQEVIAFRPNFALPFSNLRTMK
ncbi:MAG: hypothetical protein BJ554DRAFT_992 [Olpidium bornovanus]|uniref:THIF-type NAD/FAD binding fold domain-containing protein n=1 Tax=Olpidium bornovanus TaxID=278681 RepID=A0A8H7ZT68_9FUNG|nr:MAG: hypothetical protein BJ554DRAFT_992 [Olpidium bornovanus]